ncbi:MAG TPA: hypothetical protein VI386_26125 [Candidatus Sulfotelmatobacter sp.]
MEKFLAIKALTKAEAEKIWNGCFNVHQMISVAASDEKRQVFLEQFKIWRDQLIELQETLIVDRLLPLAIEYPIIENEQMWLLEVFKQAWEPVAAGYWDWLTVVVRGHPSGVAVGAIPEWAWQLRGAPRNVAPLEMGSEKKVSTHYGHLVHELQSDLVVYREGAIAKAFLAGKKAVPSTATLTEDENRQSEKLDIEARNLDVATSSQTKALGPALSVQELEAGTHTIEAQCDDPEPSKGVREGRTVETLYTHLKKIRSLYRQRGWSISQIRRATEGELAITWEWIDRIEDPARKSDFLRVNEWDDGDKFIFHQIATLYKCAPHLNKKPNWGTTREWRKAFRRHHRRKTPDGRRAQS